MAGNLLRAEVTAADVAQAFVFAALLEKTTGAVIPVERRRQCCGDECVRAR